MSDENLLEMISFLVNGQAFCLDVSVIREIRGWTPATPLPMSPPEVRGVINLRGVIMPVVDLKARLDQGLTEPSSRHVIIVMQLGDRQAGLLVEAVQETFKISRSELQAPPSLSDPAVIGLVSSILSLGGRLVSVVDPYALLPDAALAVAAA
ncbi:MAG TPA: chemotaxis protein CheW [Phenylobacterium sp.]|jgi:purine-binding chemotaxis protein CheW|uniref:Chemotaxis protein CheW n=1 Tax=Phenylobacterium conjunctum TaxID=1298959 RepID=A0ABW3SYI6_9CAUL|nr:chemotaxis protein CheW [Phenylobacterium sp.]HQP19334.1 chemotaxis protein CheW [Phenylobacterium sp.]